MIKTADEIAKMRIAGRLAADVLDMIESYVKPGVSTAELDAICHDYITIVQQGVPAPLNYKPDTRRAFPKSICTSVNDEVCHGIPGQRKLKDGDILNIDVTVIKDGYHGDTSRMFYVGKPKPLAQSLCTFCQDALYLAIKLVRPGARLGSIGAVIQHVAESHGLAVVKEYCGHGIGKNFHEDPQVLHYGVANTGLTLAAGMTFTIEPMLNRGKAGTKTLDDQWTVVTKDGELSAQWEHTILVTESGYEVLTLRAAERAAGIL